MPKDDVFDTDDDFGGADKRSGDSADDMSWDDIDMDKPEPTGSAGKGGEDAKAGEAKPPKGFTELKKSSVAGAPNNIDFILDIPLEVTVELGSTTLPIYDLLQLGQGSIIELNKIAGEPLEILVNGKLIAKGEVVVVNEKFGIRLTDVVSPQERIEKLR